MLVKVNRNDINFIESKHKSSDYRYINFTS